MANYNCPNANPQAWRACAGGSRFVGCCLRDPCATGCDPESLIRASFNPDVADQVPQLTCDDEGAHFYVCPDTSPPFLGCCKSNACNTAGGCSDDQLSPASLPSDARASAFFSPTGTPSSATATSSPSTAASGSSGAEIGGAVGGAVGGALVLVLLAWFIWRRRRRRQREAQHAAAGSTTPGYMHPPTQMTSHERAQLSKMSASPPPRYSAVHSRGPIFELEDQHGYPIEPANPVELEGSGPVPASPNPSSRASKRGLLFFRKNRPASLNIGGHDVSPQLSSDSATFSRSEHGNGRFSQVSSLSPRSPHSPYSEAGRPSPTHPPTIEEDEGTGSAAR